MSFEWPRKPDWDEVDFKTPMDAWQDAVQDRVDVQSDRLISVDTRQELWQALDIWDAFNANGGAGSWNALTYAPYIAGLDTQLADDLTSGAVTKTQIGTASDGSSPIWAYTAGDGPVGVLMVSGSHGNEVIGMWSSMRWFQVFAQGSSDAMAELRSRFRVTYVPVLNPAGYRIKHTNDNAVNVTFNYPFFWSYFSPTDPQFAKGTSPWSEPETQAIRDLVEDERFSVAIDCHNLDGTSGATDVHFVYPASTTLGGAPVLAAARSNWIRLYGGGDASRIPILAGHEMTPAFHNWAQWKMRQIFGYLDAATVSVEAPADSQGSTATLATREAVRRYCGFLTQVLAVWHTQGMALATKPYTYTSAAQRYVVTGAPLTTSITANGLVIDNTTSAPLTWDYLTAEAGFGVGSFVPGIPIVPPYAPCLATVRFWGLIESSGTACTVTCDLQMNGSSAYATDTVSVPATNGAIVRTAFARNVKLDLPNADQVAQFRVMVKTSASNPRFRRASLSVEISPNVEGLAPTPYVPRSAAV